MPWIRPEGRIDKYLINEKGKLVQNNHGHILIIGFNLKSAAGDKKQISTPDANRKDYTDETNPTLDMLDESTGYYAR